MKEIKIKKETKIEKDTKNKEGDTNQEGGKIEMPLKLKCHHKWNVITMEMSPKLKCYQNKMSLKLKCQ